MPRLQFKEKLRVRQYIIYDTSTVFYIEYNIVPPNGFSSADCQQQMRTSPTQYHTPDHRPDRLDLTSNYIRPLPSIPDYNPFYNDPDYGFELYWDIQLKRSTCFAFSWQTKIDTRALPAQDEQAHEFYPIGPQVSLTTAVEARFVNTLVIRNGEPDYVMLTTNLGLKYKQRILYFPMDFGELTLDGLVDTGALPSAIPEAS